MPLPLRHRLVGLCFLASFICYIDRVNISVAILPMQEAFGWSDTVKGLVLSAFFIGYFLFMTPGGWLANRVGGRRVLGLAVIWWSAFTMLTPVAAAVSLPALLLARVALGLGEAATYPAAYALYGRWIPAGERARSVSIMLGGIPLGTLFALLVTGWIIEQWGWPSVFYLFGVAGLAWAVAWFMLVTDDPREARGMQAGERQLLAALPARPAEPVAVPWRRLFSTRAVWALFINHFCSNWVLYILLAWLPSYFRDTQGLSISNAGIYSAAPWLTMFAMVNVAGWTADRMCAHGISVTATRKTMQSIGLLGSGGALLLASGATSLPGAVGLMCVSLGCLAFTWSGYAPNPLDIAPRYGDVLMGISNTFGTIPGIIGVAVAGWLVDVTGSYTSVFALVAAVNLFGVIVWLCFASGERVIE